jgi:hypothetical protein
LRLSLGIIQYELGFQRETEAIGKAGRVREDIYFKAMAPMIVGPTNLESGGQASRLGIQAGFPHCSLETEFLLF